LGGIWEEFWDGGKKVAASAVLCSRIFNFEAYYILPKLTFTAAQAKERNEKEFFNKTNLLTTSHTPQVYITTVFPSPDRYNSRSETKKTRRFFSTPRRATGPWCSGIQVEFERNSWNQVFTLFYRRMKG
jgi:hypothetical protein